MDGPHFIFQDLENLIIELFMSKLLHNHELGRYKTLCEKLEATLEANRKKTVQFHKEVGCDNGAQGEERIFLFHFGFVFDRLG